MLTYYVPGGISIKFHYKDGPWILDLEFSIDHLAFRYSFTQSFYPGRSMAFISLKFRMLGLKDSSYRCRVRSFSPRGGRHHNQTADTILASASDPVPVYYIQDLRIR